MPVRALTCAALTLSALSAAPAFASEDSQFNCTAIGDGIYTVFISALDPASARAGFAIGSDADPGGEAVQTALQQVASGPGFRYQGGGLDFQGKGDIATLIVGTEAATCVLLRSGAEDGGQEDAQESAQEGAGGAAPEAAGAAGNAFTPGTSAVALGGNIRSGPGTDTARTGSLAEGAAITLEQDTGVMLDSYPWFRITAANGDCGFVWGGIICAPQGDVPGVYDSCE